MSTPTFAKTHNLIAYLEKPTESQTVNDEVHIQALVDGKRVNIKESSIRRILRLEDADDTSCLTNAKIFKGLARIGYEKPSDKLTFYKAFFSPQWKFLIHTILQCLSAKTTSWNEFSNTMASAIICLATNQNFNFSSGEDSLKLKELIDFCTNLSNKVLDLESEVIDIKSTYQARIEKLESRVERLEEENKVLSMLDVNNEEPADVEELLEVVKAVKLITEDVTTAGIDVNAASVQDTSIMLLKQLKQAQIELDEEVTKQLEAELNVDINWNVVIKQVKSSERLTNAVNEGVKVPEKEVSQEKEVEVEISKREGESLEQEIAKKQKMEQETEELKKHLQIILDDDDDVYTDATPLPSKILIIDYKIHTERNRPYFKIIRADGNHMLFLSFSTMLKNFDREDLESLWDIVRERFAKTEPKNYSDDFLLNTLKIMFENPNVKANVWKDQKGKYGLAKDKRWNLFESCGVHCLTLSTTQIFLLVERMYPLTHFTLKQMINDVRLEVENESEMSLELIRLVKR
nr:synaptobrevin, longin-like domain protein [Tanacetum cinerariifolium]